MSPIQEVTSDGWLTNDLRSFRVLTEHTPPRQWSYWDQIRNDCQHPLIIWMWLGVLFYTTLGSGLIVAAFVTRYWILLLGGFLLYRGLRILRVWFQLAGNVIMSIRHDPIAMAVVGELEPHPILPELFSIGLAVRQSGEAVDIATMEPFTSAIERAGTHCMVWFLDNPDAQYQTVFAFRPIDNNPD